LNGKSLGEKAVDPFQMVSWEVPYTPGRLEAVGKTNGKKVSEFAVETTGEPVAVRLTPDRISLAGDGCDAVPVTVEALDAQGRPVPLAQNKVNFTIEGAGKIIGVGNGDPNCHDPEVFLPTAPRSVAVNGWRWKLANVPNDRSVLPEYAKDFDDSAWKELKSTDGNTIEKEQTTAIYRAHLTLTEEDLKNAELRLRFAGCDDEGWFFVNSQCVGESHDWSSQPVFNAKQFLHVGDNVIAVGVYNGVGQGGLNPNVNVQIIGHATAAPWSRSLFNGLAQVIVQSTKDAGEIKLTATADGLAPATTVVQTQPCTLRPSVR
jgi:beta-galactosidase